MTLQALKIKSWPTFCSGLWTEDSETVVWRKTFQWNSS